MVMTRENVTQRVEEVLIEALGVDPEDVRADATLTGDLGAESIDFLDIVFRLEKSFDIKIPKGELFPDDILSNAEFIEGGRLTPQGVAELKRAMPHADFTEFEKDPIVSRMSDLFTVGTIVKYVENKLQSAA